MIKPKHLLFASLALVMLASCSTKQKSRMPKQFTIEQLYNNLSVGAAGFNADETKILVDNNSTGIYNVYELASLFTRPTREVTRTRIFI